MDCIPRCSMIVGEYYRFEIESRWEREFEKHPPNASIHCFRSTINNVLSRCLFHEVEYALPFEHGP